jgi:hypothetical protein
MQTLTGQLQPSSNLSVAVEKLKNASDAQEYRIQHSLLEAETPAFSFMEELCYEAHSTALLPDPFHSLAPRHEHGLEGSIDDIWWTAEKKIESIEYFMD